MPLVNKTQKKPSPKEVKRVVIEVWKANVPLASKRKQLNMPERILRMILAHEKQSCLTETTSIQ
jgi:hypothetical protein